MNTKRKITGISITGILLLGLGIILLLDNLNLIYFNLGNFISDWWPAIFILIGVNELLKGNRSAGWSLLGLGVIIFLKINDIVDEHFIVALILILIGVGLIIRPRRLLNPQPATSQAHTDAINLQAIFSNCHENISSDNFTGGVIQVVFGKMVADFRAVKLSPGRCGLNVETIFGHTVLQIPSGIRVEVESSPVFGHIDNQAGNIPKDEDSAIIEIHAEVVFGNLEIHN